MSSGDGEVTKNVEIHSLSYEQIEQMGLSFAPSAVLNLELSRDLVEQDLPMGAFNEDSIFIVAGIDRTEVILELSWVEEPKAPNHLVKIRTATALAESLPFVTLRAAVDFAAGLVAMRGGVLFAEVGDSAPSYVREVFEKLDWRKQKLSGESVEFSSPEGQLERPIMKYFHTPPNLMFDPEQEGTYRLPTPESLHFTEGDGWLVAALPSSTSSSFREQQRSADTTLEEEFQRKLFLQPQQAGRPRGSGEEDSERTGGEWTRIPGPEASQEEMLWHYTDAGGVIGILSSRTLWATNIDSLNDSAELHHGFVVLDSVMEEVRSSRYIARTQKRYLERVLEEARSESVRRKLFVFCASEARDSLSQWRGYGGGPGYAIGLESKRAPLIAHDSDFVSARTVLPSQWSKVVYSPTNQKRLAAEALGYIAYKSPSNLDDSPALRFILGEDAFYLTRIAACLKHPSFEEEREVRVLFDASEVESAILFRAGRFGVTPYVAAAFGDTNLGVGGTPMATRSRDELPIGSIMVGPSSHPEAAVSGLSILATAHEVNVPVVVSDAPYRT